MTIELRPIGVACNLSCTYCYQEPMRDAQNIHTKYDLDKMIAQLEKVGHKFNVFGGEALLIPKKDLATLWEYGFKRFGANAIQTNGTLIDDEHIEMFKKYNVHVGISIDGPNELNDLRVVGNSLEKTREATQKTIDNIVKLVKEGIVPGIIITVHKVNAFEDRLDRLKRFIRWLGDIGVKGGNMHLLEIDNELVARRYCLSEEENAQVFLEFAKFFDENPDLSWNPFSEIPQMLLGNDERATCNWKMCDPLNTQAVYGIEGDGALSNCGRSNKEGIDWYKADDTGYERYISLYHTPPEMNGCQGCRFWALCSGSCPGESVDGDFRNKTVHCHTVKTLFTYYEEKLEQQGHTPITKHPLRWEAEQFILDSLRQGKYMELSKAVKAAEKSCNPNTLKVYREGVRVL